MNPTLQNELEVEILLNEREELLEKIKFTSVFSEEFTKLRKEYNKMCKRLDELGAFD